MDGAAGKSFDFHSGDQNLHPVYHKLHCAKYLLPSHTGTRCVCNLHHEQTYLDPNQDLLRELIKYISFLNLMKLWLFHINQVFIFVTIMMKVTPCFPAKLMNANGTKWYPRNVLKSVCYQCTIPSDHVDSWDVILRFNHVGGQIWKRTEIEASDAENNIMYESDFHFQTQFQISYTDDWPLLIFLLN